MATQVFIVEDQAALRRDYALLLQREPDIAVCGAVASSKALLPFILHKQPDLVIVNIFLPGIYGLTLITHLYKAQPTLPILLISNRELIVHGHRKTPTRLPNVKGYLHKEVAPQRLVTAIRQVLTP